MISEACPKATQKVSTSEWLDLADPPEIKLAFQRQKVDPNSGNIFYFFRQSC